MNLNERIDELKKEIDEKKAYYSMLERVYKEKIELFEKKTKELENIEKTINIIQNFYSNMQMDIVFKFEQLITEGINEVFEDNYKFKIDFKKEINNITCDFYLVLPNGKMVNLSAEGGGIKDFISVLFRIIYLILINENRSKIIFLDENLKHLDSFRAIRAIKFINKLCDRLGIQVLFITHLNIDNIEDIDKYNIIRL